MVEQAQGGDHDPNNLALLIRRWHRLVHRRKWKQRLDPQTGRFTISRNGRSWHSLPRGTPSADLHRAADRVCMTRRADYFDRLPRTRLGSRRARTGTDGTVGS